MTNRELILSLMREQHITNAEMAKKLSISQAALWDRLNTKKAKDLTTTVFQQMLAVLGYDLVVTKQNSTLPDNSYVVNADEHIENPSKQPILTEETAPVTEKKPKIKLVPVAKPIDLEAILGKKK